MSAYMWKRFSEDEDRPEKPRRCGVTEMRGPSYTLMNNNVLQDIFDSMGQYIDGLKFSGGSNSLMSRQFIKEVIEMAHRSDIYVSTGNWSEHLLHRGPAAFRYYLEECKHLGFDIVELNVSSLKMPEDALLRFVRLAKQIGLKVKPEFTMRFESSDGPSLKDRAFGSYQYPVDQKFEHAGDVDMLIRQAERCLEAGADIIMIDAHDGYKYINSLRTDNVAKIVGRLGLEKTMFEASNPSMSEWFVKKYGPKINLFVDHSQVMKLECLRGCLLGENHTSLLASYRLPVGKSI